MMTVTFLKFPRKHRWNAIKQMGIGKSWLEKVEGCPFFKLMGSGAGNGFSIFPDFSTYCLLMKWKDTSSRDRFFAENSSWQDYHSMAEQSFTLFLRPTKVVGKWDGRQPFELDGNNDVPSRSEIVVLTRATIKKRFIPYFWSQVPQASANVRTTEGHIFSKGVGEVPLLHQATVSVWKDKEAMYNYAYRHDSHINMIRKTREKGWYSEELFAEFKLDKIIGEIW